MSKFVEWSRNAVEFSKNVFNKPNNHEALLKNLNFEMIKLYYLMYELKYSNYSSSTIHNLHDNYLFFLIYRTFSSKIPNLVTTNEFLYPANIFKSSTQENKTYIAMVCPIKIEDYVYKQFESDLQNIDHTIFNKYGYKNANEVLSSLKNLEEKYAQAYKNMLETNNVTQVVTLTSNEDSTKYAKEGLLIDELHSLIPNNIEHIKFKKWPDGFAPNEEDVITLKKEVENLLKDENKVLAIHCKGGIGRTGTVFALLEAMMMFKQFYDNLSENNKETIKEFLEQSSIKLEEIASAFTNSAINIIRPNITNDIDNFGSGPQSINHNQEKLIQYMMQSYILTLFNELNITPNKPNYENSKGDILKLFNTDNSEKSQNFVKEIQKEIFGHADQIKNLCSELYNENKTSLVH